MTAELRGVALRQNVRGKLVQRKFADVNISSVASIVLENVIQTSGEATSPDQVSYACDVRRESTRSHVRDTKPAIL